MNEEIDELAYTHNQQSFHLTFEHRKLKNKDNTQFKKTISLLILLINSICYRYYYQNIVYRR